MDQVKFFLYRNFYLLEGVAYLAMALVVLAF
jgi:hypothetical protein